MGGVRFSLTIDLIWLQSATTCSIFCAISRYPNEGWLQDGACPNLGKESQNRAVQGIRRQPQVLE
jgi:hypothetical protein